VIARSTEGARLVAIAEPQLLSELAGRSLVGKKIAVSGSEPPSYRLAGSGS